MRINGYIAAIVFAACLTAGFAAAKEGHDDAPKATVTTDATTRSEAQTELFELVATSGNGQLTVFLDRFASNEPVIGAKVEVESGNWKGVAVAAEHGSYRVKAPQFAKPGRYPLLFTVQAGADADLIETTLVVAEPATLDAAAHPWGSGLMWWAGGGLAALGGVALLLKCRRPGRSGPGRSGPGRFGATPQQANRT